MSFWNGHRWEASTPPTAEVKSATPSRAKRVGGAVLEAALITALTFGLIAGTAFAAKGGRTGGGGGGGGHHGGGGSTLTATVVVNPNPAAAFSQFSITGCGYVPSAGVQLNLYTTTATSVWGATADAGGCLAATGWANSAGSARLDVLQSSTTLVASTTFMVQ
jgi:hypothetical protein